MSTVKNARALHYVFKIGDRAANLRFFRDVLGMQVLRHEEFQEGCEAQCNGPYDNRWSKTMVGYGPESDFFAMELTYNYGVNSYELGNDFGGVTIKSKEALERAEQLKYPIAIENDVSTLVSPDGYKFFILPESQPKDADPVCEVTLYVHDLERSKKYWHEILNMEVVCECEDAYSFSYGEKQARLRLKKASEDIKRCQAYGRIAFSVPHDVQPGIQKKIKSIDGTILKPLITLETPGKATVRVVILADPDCHEICFVDDEGFRKLSEVDPESNDCIEKYIQKDPFQNDKNAAKPAQPFCDIAGEAARSSKKA